jgi:multiple sugar transport system substrate-binding protein
VGEDKAFASSLNSKLPGSSAFVSNLANAKKARPQVTVYPAISQALGNAIVSVLLGKATPADALAAAAKATDQALAGS